MIALDRVRVRAEDVEPITLPVDKARIAVVASGVDAERIRQICHQMKLFVPVMANMAIVHESLRMVVVGEPSPPAPERVVHVIRPNIPDQALRELLQALASGKVPAPPPSRAIAAEAPVLTQVRRLETARDLGAIEALATEAVVALTGADRAYYLAYEGDGRLWSEAERRRGGDDRSAIAGLAGWSARTGLPVHAPCAGDDPRWFPAIDDPDGKAQTRIAVHPIVTDARRVRAVLVSVRRWRHAPFSDGDLRWLATYAELAAPIIERILSRPISVPPPLPPEPEPEAEPEELADEDVAHEPDEEEDADDQAKTGLMAAVEPPEDTTVESIPSAPTAAAMLHAGGAEPADRAPPRATLAGMTPREPRAPAETREPPLLRIDTQPDVQTSPFERAEIDDDLPTQMPRVDTHEDLASAAAAAAAAADEERRADARAAKMRAAERAVAAARAALAEAEAALALAKTTDDDDDD